MSKKITDSPIQTELLVHDLKIPISVIDAGAKSLLNREDAYGPLTEKQKKVLRRIIRNTLCTQRLVNDILELGRSREGVVACVEFTLAGLVTSVLVEIFDYFDPSVAEAVRNARTLDGLCRAVKEKDTRLFFDAPAWETRLCLDLAKVKQVLRNLVTNAFKHRSRFVEISGRVEGNQLVLTVRDDGRGIPKSDLQNIFKTYFTNGDILDSTIQSHGLGLAGVLTLLKDMGGELALVSEDGNGAEFIATIPF